MNPDLAQYGDGESVEGFPSFVRAYPEVLPYVANQSAIYDWWRPTRSGNDAADYATGSMHFVAIALLAAECGNAPNVLANVLGAMMRHGVKAMERGFIDALARKATFSRPPDPLPESMVSDAVALSEGTLTAERLRYGEQYAREWLDCAREAQCPEVIGALLTDLVKCHDDGGPGAIWRICGAAMAGASN